MSSTRQTVSMIGLGQMGSALATAVLVPDLDVSVWNRSVAKSEQLAAQGAAVAHSVSDAVSRSEVIVVCLRGYDAAEALFRDEDVAPLLAGKIVVQLGNGVPTEVAAAAAWFSGQGAAYLDGSIMSYPDTVGSEACQVLVSGDPSAFEQCRPIFDAIGGDIRFLGADPMASAVINSSTLAFVYLNAHAFLTAAAMCDAADAPLDLLAELVGSFTSQMPPMLEQYVAMIDSGRYDSTTLRLATGADNLRAIADFGRQSGVDTRLIETAVRTLDEAAEAGHGINLAAVFETLRKPKD
jgi:3-hydroxyisobutyrate dehydrogenase-like beta-hydroxyacid dehydrogenase